MGIEVNSTANPEEIKRTLYERAVEEAARDLEAKRQAQAEAKSSHDAIQATLSSYQKIADQAKGELENANDAVAHAEDWLAQVKALRDSEMGA